MAHVTMPPKVLPTVATPMAGQNRCGFNFTRPNTAGSEPSGNKVAEKRTADTSPEEITGLITGAIERA